ncbi:50S ribosomal protein L3 N(5)-glutamine methyltransferase, partial [Francisella tularensis subsp. holarctica]|nr:50S ribosomal protein L3 N(5)-glutamine methyltransferase [Francisella tularensis subsp. holarctica]
MRWSISEMTAYNVYFGHGSESIWDEAVHLVLSAINVAHDIDSNMVGSSLLTEEKKIIIDYVYKRASLRKPLQYIIKKAWYEGMEI